MILLPRLWIEGLPSTAVGPIFVNMPKSIDHQRCCYYNGTVDDSNYCNAVRLPIQEVLQIYYQEVKAKTLAGVFSRLPMLRMVVRAVNNTESQTPFQPTLSMSYRTDYGDQAKRVFLITRTCCLLAKSTYLGADSNSLA